MRGVIIYKSKYGATRQYAQWLSNELKFPAVHPEEINADDIINADLVVFGSAVYMGKLLIKNWLKRNLDLVKNKKLFLFIVCATPPAEKEKLNEIVKNNVPLSIMDRTTIHFLHGKMNIKGLTWTDRLFLKMGARLEKDPKTKKEMLTDFDAVKRENITALINDVKAFNSGVSIAV